MRKGPLAIGVALLVVGTVAVVVLVGGGKSSSPATTVPTASAASVTCLGGSEKQAFMADPQIQNILRTKYHLSVDYRPQGSYQQVELPTAQLKAQHIDCLWKIILFDKQTGHPRGELRLTRIDIEHLTVHIQCSIHLAVFFEHHSFNKMRERACFALCLRTQNQVGSRF